MMCYCSQAKLRPVLKTYKRDLSKIELVREISVSLAKNREEVIAKYKMVPAFAHSIPLAKQCGREPLSIERAFKRSLIGNADEIIKKIQRYIDVNVRHFMLNFAVTNPR